MGVVESNSIEDFANPPANVEKVTERLWPTKRVWCRRFKTRWRLEKAMEEKSVHYQNTPQHVMLVMWVLPCYELLVLLLIWNLVTSQDVATVRCWSTKAMGPTSGEFSFLSGSNLSSVKTVQMFFLVIIFPCIINNMLRVGNTLALWNSFLTNHSWKHPHFIKDAP